MTKRKCAIFLFDGYADWEPALAIAGLRQYGGFEVNSFGINREPIISNGGLKILPDLNADEVNVDDYELLIIPGGAAWEEGKNREIIPLVTEFQQKKRKVAAICGATILLAEMGLLNASKHTSNNDSEYIRQFCPSYQGASLYQKEPATTDNGIITANGAAMVEFAHEIFKSMEIMPPEVLDNVKLLYKSGGMDNRLMQYS
ncbi:putative intracellular protease (ThiJ/PfpI family) [Fulvivirga imtechensis AK7]|uniref:Putative intracellular protease (ThiJ/PfpI family) n=1 Tax=Fulvivirga imtechensis AK7 TaxID=1237149 RepID=L8JNL3_9BACT|nr:type 1 glutamine amidotransferase family protein [Fulvivirga imtechensis]ELR70556.1 putative intracellular protease (ThiJ/PfpI family) [Fulvivirga imtechensis AK7]